MPAVHTGPWSVDHPTAHHGGSDDGHIVRLVAGTTSAPFDEIKRIVAEQLVRSEGPRVPVCAPILIERAVRRQPAGR